MFFAGGGVRGGTVIGSTDKIGAYPAANPQTPENMAATIYQALGIPRELAWHDATGPAALRLPRRPDRGADVKAVKAGRKKHRQRDGHQKSSAPSCGPKARLRARGKRDDVAGGITSHPIECGPKAQPV